MVTTVDQLVQFDAGGQDVGIGLAPGFPEGLEPVPAGGDLVFEDGVDFEYCLLHGSFLMFRKNMV